MMFPTVIQIRNRKVMGGCGVLSGVHVNTPQGRYQVYGVVNVKEEGFNPLIDLSIGKPFAKILSVKPGVLAVIEPMEIIHVQA